jgi:omega-6 fatty acid desaturase (delta-12 desaturase)
VEAALITDWVAEPLAEKALTVQRASVDARSLARGLGIFAVYAILYAFTLADALGPLPIWANIVFAIGNGLMIAMLFLVGHDCQHGAFVPGREWNVRLGQLAFLPCLHGPSLWRYTHHVLHHGWTNLKGKDPVWAPMGVEEYRAASPARRLLERAYRSAAGPLIYYYAKFWPFMVLLPVSSKLRGRRMRHLPDAAFILSGFAITLIAIGWLGHVLAPQRSLWLTIMLGWAIPFAVWNYLAGFSFYLNHTHPELPWFNDEELWRKHGNPLNTTVGLKMPLNILPLYASSMAHTAHHDRPATPIYALEAAQAALKEQDGRIAREYVLSIREYRRIVRTCKLFDFRRMCWTDFSGNPTSLRLIP